MGVSCHDKESKKRLHADVSENLQKSDLLKIRKISLPENKPQPKISSNYSSDKNSDVVHEIEETKNHTNAEEIKLANSNLVEQSPHKTNKQFFSQYDCSVY